MAVGDDLYMVGCYKLLHRVQVQQYGYIPSALPDANCFGSKVASSTPRQSSTQVASRFD